MSKNRIIWIDWLKVFGIFLIIWGHMFPPMITDFIYSFSVPLFFITSGFLHPFNNSTPPGWGM